MAIEVIPEQSVLSEAIEILVREMDAPRVARLLSVLRVGEGDYLRIREGLFAGETVDSLYAKVREHQEGSSVAAEVAQ